MPLGVFHLFKKKTVFIPPITQKFSARGQNKGVQGEIFVSQMNSAVLPLQGTFISSVVLYKPLRFNKTYIYPTWAYALGWFLGLFCVFVVPLWILFKVVQMKGTVWQVRAKTNSNLSTFLNMLKWGVNAPHRVGGG